MHIPQSTTAQVEVLRFADALRAAQAPAEGYSSEKWLYVPPFYAEYRYILGTRGQKPLICVGINPSTAEPGRLDPTLKSVERITHANGFDSFLMFNVYAERATNPDDLEMRCNTLLHRENLQAFDYLLHLSSTPAVWAAWGTIIEKRDYLALCVRDLLALGEDVSARWYCAGARTKRGHPHHPLYLRKDEPLRPFDVKSYLEAL